jgi:hypothetical protein
MAVFALRTVDDVRVSVWLRGVSERLNEPSFVTSPLKGRVRSLGKGLWVLEVVPTYSRMVLNCIMLFLLAGSIMLGWAGLWTLYWLVGLCVVVTNLFWSAGLYQAIVWWQVRKLTGVFHKVRRADNEVLLRVLHGKA